MDKKTIIGIIIIAAILMLIPYYERILGIRKEPADKKTEIVDSLAVVPSDRTALDIGKPAQGRELPRPSISQAKEHKIYNREIGVPQTDSMAPVASETIIFVKTRRYEITLSNIGGTVTSIKSNEFSGFSDERLEFCPSTIEGDNIIVVAYSGDSAITTEGLAFVADKESLVLTDKNPDGEITFISMLSDGKIIQRKYHFTFEGYSFEHSFMISGEGEGSIDASVLWWRKGLEPSETLAKTNISADYKIGYLAGSDYMSKSFKKDERPQFSFDGNIVFVATHNKYFAAIISPYEGFGTGLLTDGTWVSGEGFRNAKMSIPVYGIGLAQRGDKLPYIRRDMIYIGPRDYNILKRYGRGFEKTVNLGWSVLAPLTKLFLWIFGFLHLFLKNYGIVIIVFSILIKLLLLPLTNVQMKSLKRMKELEPKMIELREKYKTDVKRLNEETMKLYKKEKINPFSGCLWLLPQMPIFFSLFSVLNNAFALRGAPFVLWIKDLSQKDPYFILPILMAVSMFVQQKMTTTDPKQKMMIYMMPILFLFLFRNMPSGLVLYWLVFNLLSLAQTIWTEKFSMKPKPVDA